MMQPNYTSRTSLWVTNLQVICANFVADRHVDSPEFPKDREILYPFSPRSELLPAAVLPGGKKETRTEKEGRRYQIYIKRREKERKTDSAVGFTGESRAKEQEKERERCRQEQDMEETS